MWVPLDPALKDRTVLQEGIDLPAEMGFAWKDFADEYLSRLTRESPIEYYEQKLDQFVEENYSGETIETLSRKTEIREMKFDFLPNTLPCVIEEIIDRFPVIPGQDRYYLRIYGLGGIDHTVSMTEAAGRRLNISFEGADPEDRAVIDEFGGLFNTPPYLIDVVSRLTIGGISAAEGAPVRGADRLNITVELIKPGGDQETFSHTVYAGSFSSIGLTAGKARPELATLSQVEETGEPYLSKMLHSLAMRYHLAENNTRALLNRTMKIQSRTYISEALVATEHDLDMWWTGIARGFKQVGFSIDAKSMESAIIPVDGYVKDKVIDFMMVAGMEASYEENRTFEDAMFWVGGLSAVKAIQALNTIGTPVYEYRPGDIYFSPLAPDVVENDINNALNRNWNVIAPLSDGGLPVFPYIKYDPETGSAGYMIATIAGGYNEYLELGADLQAQIDLNLTWSGTKELTGLDFESVPPPEAGITKRLGDSLFVPFKMITTWKENGETWTEEFQGDTSYFNIRTGSNLFTTDGLPLSWWFPGHYNLKYGEDYIFDFNLWGAAIDGNKSDTHITLRTDKGVDIVQEPATITYMIPDIPNMNIASVYMRIYDSAGTAIWNKQLSKTALYTQTIKWDGTNDSKQVVPPGEYTAKLEVEGEGGMLQSEHNIAVLKTDLDGYDANSGTEVPDKKEASQGTLIMEHPEGTNIQTARLITYAPGVDGYKREITWSGNVEKILVSKTSDGDFANPQNETISDNTDITYYIKADPAFEPEDSVEVTMKVKKTGSSEVIHTDTILLDDIPVDIKAKFKIIENETEMKIVEEEGQAPYYRVLGGMRIHLDSLVSPSITSSNPVTEYEWSATSGKFYNSFDVDAQQLNTDNLKGPARKDIYWQGDPSASLNETITLKITFQDGKIVEKQGTIKSRVLKNGDSGDDVSMLQAFMRMIGISQGDTPGVIGIAVKVDGDFGPGTETALKRLEYRDEAVEDGVVSKADLDKFILHWSDYLKAIKEIIPNSPRVDITHSKFPEWLKAGADELENTYTNNIQKEVNSNVTREAILKAWISQETGKYGHWGYNLNYRITLGSGDNLGSIGFSQIQNWFKYGDDKKRTGLHLYNLYSPRQGIKGFALWSNDKQLGGGFYRGFVDNVYQKTVPSEDCTQNAYPRIIQKDGLKIECYKDDMKDVLSKSIMAYKSGAWFYELNNFIWPEILKKYDPKLTDVEAVKGIRYSLGIRFGNNINAGLLPRTWTWKDKEGTKEYTFTYSEAEWFSNISWKQKRDASIPKE